MGSLSVGRKSLGQSQVLIETLCGTSVSPRQIRSAPSRLAEDSTSSASGTFRTCRSGRCMSAFGGWSQPVDATLYLKEEMECGDGTEISSRVHGGREDGVMGQLEARRVAEGDRTGFWQAVIVDLFPGGPARRHSSCAAAPLKAGIDAVGARGDFQRHCGASIGTLDRQVAWPLTLDGEPGNEPQWRP